MQDQSCPPTESIASSRPFKPVPAISFCLFCVCVLSRWSNHQVPCGICPAKFRGIMSWLDNRKCAGWLANGITCAHWASTCAVFEIPGVVGTSLALDYMHNMFLGWLQYLYGSIMYMLVFVVMGGSDMENLTAIAAFIKKDQKARGTTHKYRPRLDKLSMFKKKRATPDSEAGPLTSWDCTIQCWPLS